jgi:short-chain Z-isoprenyl diphosphate synthase
MGLTDLAYRSTSAGSPASSRVARCPRHVGVIIDGNRRYAAERGLPERLRGPRRRRARIDPFLDWCLELDIGYVTLWLLSTDNLDRDDVEVARLLGIIEETVRRMASRPDAAERGLRLTAVGALDLLPESTRTCLKEAEEATAHHDRLRVQIAVGYGGRQEITDALRSLLAERAAAGESLEELARTLRPEDIGGHLYTNGTPDPDLIIRTSGEVRLSGFLMWQSAHSEFYFCDPYWPEFRRVDFLRALRDYQRRTRRFGR